MPPRFQCLNSSKQILCRPTGLRAAFSTTTRVAAENPTSKPVGSFFQDTDRSHAAPSDNGAIAATEAVSRLVSNAQQAQMASPRTAAVAKKEMEDHLLASSLTKQIFRRWRAGDTYTQHDLSSVEQKRWKKREAVDSDCFDVLGFDPLANYKNFAIMSEYMTPMGRIKHRKDTGLRGVNQRKMARAIRRTIGIGMMPSVHRHPMIIEAANNRQARTKAYRSGPM